MTVWATFDRKALRYTAGEPAVYRSSDIAQREFCRRCGSQLAYRMIDDNSELTINIGSLDDPERFPPQMHIWCDSQVSWFDTKDDLPRYPRDEPN